MPLYLGRMFLLVLLMTPLFASVKLFAPKAVKEGEFTVFKIVARGFHIKFPEIDFIEGHLVEELKSSSEAFISGTQKMTQTTKIYHVLIKKDFLLPSFIFTIDGKKEQTDAQNIEIKKITKTVSPNYDLQMQISQREVYVGEEFSLSLIFSYKDVEDYVLIKPEFPQLQLTLKSEESFKQRDGDYAETHIYDVVAKEAGSFRLKPAKAEVELVSQKGFKRKKVVKTVYSNALQLKVLPLPKNVSVIGNYEMISTVFKQKVKQGEAVKMRLELMGKGNINNLDSFSFKIPKATLFSHKDDNNSMRKNFEIIANEDFEIPALTLTYFDTKLRKVMKIVTPKYQILVGDVRSAKKDNIVKKAKVVKKVKKKKLVKVKEGISMIEKIIYFLLGVIATALCIYFYKKIKAIKPKEPESLLVKELQSLQNKEAFFKRVVPLMGRDKALDRLIYKLESKDVKSFKKLKADALVIIKGL